MHFKSVLFIIFLGLLSFNLGCSGEAASGSGSGSSTDGGGPIITSASPLSLEVSSNYEVEEDEAVGLRETLGTCAIEPGTLPFSGSGLSDISCIIRVPELKLYYSDLTFTISANSGSRCTKVSFIPYAYRRSNNVAYTPKTGADPVDCQSGVEKVCYGGAGPDMIEDYPETNSVYFLASETKRQSFKLRSSNSRRTDDKDRSMIVSNVNAANNLSNRGTSMTSPVNYFQNSMNDYIFACEDPWFNALYSITLVIADDDNDTSGPIRDERYDWGD